MSKGARNHHFVSQCYLRGFTAGEQRTSKLFVVDMIKRTAFETLARNVAAERDFNRIDLEALDPNAVENDLANFEGKLAPALKRIRENVSLDDGEDRTIFLNFVCLLAMRNPRLRERMETFEKTAINRLMELTLSDRKTWEAQVQKARATGYLAGEGVDYEEVKRHFEGEGFSIEIPRTRHVTIEIRLFDKILPVLFERRWTLLKPPPGSAGFVTSDHPFCLMWTDPKMRAGPYGPGLGMRGTEIIFPIAKDLAAIGVFEGEESVRLLQSEQLVALINGTVIAFAERQVYGQDDRFCYSVHVDEPPAKARDLLRDYRFRRLRSKDKSL